MTFRSRIPTLAAIATAAVASAGPCAGAQTSRDSLRLYYVGRPVGWERYEIAADAQGSRLSSDFQYVDRGRHSHLQATLEMGAGFSPRRLEVTRVADTTRTVVTRVEIDGRRATVLRGGKTRIVELPAVAFPISPYTPIAQHVALIRYWKAHGSPPSLATVPGGAPTISITRLGVDTIETGSSRVRLTRYGIDGVVWGTEYAWFDASDRLAMFASAGGGLSTKGVRADLVPSYDALMVVAARAALKNLAAVTAKTSPIASGAIALVGAALIDGTGRAAVGDATVVVSGGRIVAAGPRGAVTIPANARRIDVRGKTIVPGLWDMHAHLHQSEWASVYVAAGVTTVRDMGNELAFITALRSAIESNAVRGPRVLAAGLVDGGGPNAFGAFSATSPDEGRAIVRRYHSLGFEQMKLYSLLAPDVVAAICREAHALGMTVTGHVPISLGLLPAVDSGMDQIAHLPIRGDARPDSLATIINHLRAHGTVIDPTVSWNEIGGHSTAEPLQNFQPVVQHLPVPFVEFRVAGWGTPNPDTAAAHARLARSLQIVRALHDAGIPIVAGTDEGVPGFSVYREIELYAKAGLSPMEAIRSATAVPAKVMRLDGELGTIEAGKRADLIVLDANPLENISNIRTVRWVMTRGVLFDSAALWRAAGFNP
jgi:imidazolonepropionase-like amidohydrolase